MIYRGNPALEPSGTSTAAVVSHLVCEAVFRRLQEEYGSERFRSLLALHELDQRSSSEILRVAARRAEDVASSLRQAGVDVAPTGSGRKHAQDRGGRIASAGEVWVAALKRDLVQYVHPANRLSPVDLDLWGAAHPEFDRVLTRLRTMAGAVGLAVDSSEHIPFVMEALEAALMKAEIREAPPKMAEPTESGVRW